MDLTDHNVTFQSEPFELSISGVSPDAVPAPDKSPLETALREAVEITKKEIAVKKQDKEDTTIPEEPEEPFAAFDEDNAPLSLGDLMSPGGADETPRRVESRKRYQAPPLDEALKVSEYFTEEHPGAEEDLDEHYDDPGATTERELGATRGKLTTNDRAATERMVNSADKGFNPR